MKEIAAISRAFDECFVRSLDKGFNEFREALVRTREILLNQVRDGDHQSILHIQKAELDRLISGGVRRGLQPSSCHELFVERKKLGFENPVDEWLLLQMIISHWIDSGAGDEPLITSRFDSMEQSLQEVFDGCEESIAQLALLRERWSSK